MKSITVANSIDSVTDPWNVRPYDGCENGLEAIKRHIVILEQKRTEGEGTVPMSNYFLRELVAAKIVLTFLMSFDKEAEALEAMSKLNHEYLRSEDICLEFVIEVLNSRDYSLFEF